MNVPDAVGSVLQLFRDLPSLCSVLHYPPIPWKNWHMHSWTCYRHFQLVRRAGRYGGDMPPPWRPGTRGETPCSASLDWTGQHHLTVRVIGKCSLDLFSQRIGDGFWQTDGTLHYPFLYSVPDILSLSNIKTTSTNKMYYFFSSLPFSLSLPSIREWNLFCFCNLFVIVLKMTNPQIHMENWTYITFLFLSLWVYVEIH